MVTIEEKINKLIEKIDKNNKDIKDSLEELKSEIEISKNNEKNREHAKDFAEKDLIDAVRKGIFENGTKEGLEKKLNEEIKNKENEIQELKQQLEIINLSEVVIGGRDYDMAFVQQTIYPQLQVGALIEKSGDGIAELIEKGAVGSMFVKAREDEKVLVDGPNIIERLITNLQKEKVETKDETIKRLEEQLEVKNKRIKELERDSQIIKAEQQAQALKAQVELAKMNLNK